MEDNSLPLPPQDLIVSCLECRPFITPEGTVKLPTKPSCSHYHLKMKCLKAADPNFSPRCIVLPADVKKGLQAQHYAILSSFGLAFDHE